LVPGPPRLARNNRVGELPPTFPCGSQGGLRRKVPPLLLPAPHVPPSFQKPNGRNQIIIVATKSKFSSLFLCFCDTCCIPPFCCYLIRMVMGRPKLPDSDRRGAELRIRLTRAERKRLDVAARAKGMETSTWARELLLAHSGSRKTGKGPNRSREG
jgi:hypothetical protein